MAKTQLDFGHDEIKNLIMKAYRFLASLLKPIHVL